MNKLLLTIIFLFCSMPLFAEIKIPIEITNIIDGDTVEAKIDNNKFKIRLIGVDCYETCKISRAYKQAYENQLNIDNVIKIGRNSKLYLQNLYKNNKNIYLDFKGLDVYGRVLGVVYFDNLNVNDELLKNGGCFKYEYNK